MAIDKEDASANTKVRLPTQEHLSLSEMTSIVGRIWKVEKVGLILALLSAIYKQKLEVLQL